MKKLFLIATFILSFNANNSSASEPREEERQLVASLTSPSTLACCMRDPKDIESFNKRVESLLPDPKLSVLLWAVEPNDVDTVKKLLAPLAKKMDHLYIILSNRPQHHRFAIDVTCKILESCSPWNFDGLLSIHCSYRSIGDTGVILIDDVPTQIDNTPTLGELFPNYVISDENCALLKTQFGLQENWTKILPASIQLASWFRRG